MMVCWLWAHLLAVFTFGSIILCHGADEKMGPFIMKLSEIGRCPSVETTEDFVLVSSKVSKIGRNKYTYSTKMNFREELNDDLDLSVDLGVYENGGYKPYFMKQEFAGSCTSLKNYLPDFFKLVLESVNTTGCPIPPGEYDMDLNTDVFSNLRQIEKFFYGKYRANVFLTRGGINKGCMSYYVDIVPKNPKRAG